MHQSHIRIIASIKEPNNVTSLVKLDASSRSLKNLEKGSNTDIFLVSHIFG